MDCCICFNTFPKLATCPYCEAKICKPCTRMYIDGKINSDCPACRKQWSRSVLFKMLGRTYLAKDYKEKRQKELFDLQTVQLADTQQFVEEEKRAQTADFVRKALNNLNKANAIAKGVLAVERPIAAAIELLIPLTITAEEDVSMHRHNRAVFKCPATDCRGFVSGTDCSLCGNIVCKKCRTIKQDDHVCNPDEVASVKALRSETRPCPTCAIPIYKIDGCDQMWCTACHTAFSWRTGEIETKRIHNPHYYNWQRTQPGGLPPERDGPPPNQGCVQNDLPAFWQLPKRDIIMDSHRLITHAIYDELYQYQTNAAEKMRNVRVDYLMSKIDLPKFQKRIQEVDKIAERNREVLDVLQNYITIGREVLWAVTKESNDGYEKAETVLVELTMFTRSALDDLKPVFMMKVPKFLHDDTVEWLQ